jgi:hypothetical protein
VSGAEQGDPSPPDADVKAPVRSCGDAVRAGYCELSHEAGDVLDVSGLETGQKIGNVVVGIEPSRS